MLILVKRKDYWYCNAKRLTTSLLESAEIARRYYAETGRGTSESTELDKVLFERSPGVLCRLPMADSQIALAEVYENVEYLNHRIERLEAEKDQVEIELNQLYSERTSKSVPGIMQTEEFEFRYCAVCGRNIVNRIVKPLCGRCSGESRVGAKNRKQ